MRSTWGDNSGSYRGGNWLPFSFQGLPFIRGFLVAAAAVFLLYFLAFSLRGPLLLWLGYSVDARFGYDWLLRPWTWFTYPVLITSPFSLIFGGYWLYLAGGTLERSWGSRNFAALFLIFNAIAALAWVPAAYLFNVSFQLQGLMLPLCILTVAWAALDPELVFNIYGILPVKLKTLALIDVLFVYFSYGFGYGAVGPLVGLFALVGPAAAIYYVRKLPRLNLGYRAPRSAPPRREPLLREDPSTRERVTRPNPFRKRQEQAEIERLRRLLGDDDDDGRPATRH